MISTPLMRLRMRLEGARSRGMRTRSCCLNSSSISAPSSIAPHQQHRPLGRGTGELPLEVGVGGDLEPGVGHEEAGGPLEAVADVAPQLLQLRVLLLGDLNEATFALPFEVPKGNAGL